MADNSKCRDETCTLKETCWRFQAEDNPFRQSYGNYKQDKDGNCDYYWEFQIDNDIESK